MVRPPPPSPPSCERWSSLSQATLHECFWGHRHRQSGARTHLRHFTPQTGQGRLQLGVLCLYFIQPPLQGKGEGWYPGLGGGWYRTLHLTPKGSV